MENLPARIRNHSFILRDSDDLDPLISIVRPDLSFVFLCPAAIGGHEFVNWQAEISKKLIVQRGFNEVVLSGDGSEIAGLDSYVRHLSGSEKTAYNALRELSVWPSWIYANWEMIEFLEWLRDLNDGLPNDKHIGLSNVLGEPSAKFQKVVWGQMGTKKNPKHHFLNVGMSVFAGSVFAASRLQGFGETLPLPQALSDSWEDIFHQTGKEDKIFIAAGNIHEAHQMRCIGPVFNPNDQNNNYSFVILPEIFDAFIYLEIGRAVNPLYPQWKKSDLEFA